MLGQMHIAGQSFAECMPNPRAQAWRASTTGQVRRFLAPQDATLLDSEITFLQQHTLESLPQGVIHADLFRDNVLLDENRIGGLIDFYFACNDSLLYDVAITVNDWCMDADGLLDAARTRSLLRAYHAVRPFQEAERDTWLVALRAAALRFWLSRLFDLHLPRDGELIHAHDPDQFKRILLGHITADDVIWL
jgi:homoserine kinase type II